MADALRPGFRQAFLDELLLVETYLGRRDGRRGRAFTRAVFDFAYEVVGTLPNGFPGYQHPSLPGVALRRAVFRGEYALLYQVTDEAVSSVYFYHTRRDISQQDILPTA